MILPIANRFVAGETDDGAVDRAKELDSQGVGAILNLLGEHYTKPEPAKEDAEVYLELAERIADANIKACISVKPSQVGLDVGEDLFAKNMHQIGETANESGTFLWIDMEDHTTTDATLDVYEELTTQYDGGVGVCVQANLKRTEEDIERLADLPGKVRLVKGAYDEPAEIAYQKKERVNEAYRDLMRYMFEEFEDGVAIGSHDPEVISLAQDLHDTHGTGFEVQMLMGVREDAQFDLADEHEVWQYVPYGDKWMSYFYRRLVERKENALFALRAIAGR